jgi:hypothetical protein
MWQSQIVVDDTGYIIMHGLRINVEDHVLFAAFGTGPTPVTHGSIPSLSGARRSFATRGVGVEPIPTTEL